MQSAWVQDTGLDVNVTTTITLRYHYATPSQPTFRGDVSARVQDEGESCVYMRGGEEERRGGEERGDSYATPNLSQPTFRSDVSARVQDEVSKKLLVHIARPTTLGSYGAREREGMQMSVTEGCGVIMGRGRERVEGRGEGGGGGEIKDGIIIQSWGGDANIGNIGIR